MTRHQDQTAIAGRLRVNMPPSPRALEAWPSTIGASSSGKSRRRVTTTATPSSASVEAPIAPLAPVTRATVPGSGLFMGPTLSAPAGAMPHTEKLPRMLASA
jgi:hypothetical protein